MRPAGSGSSAGPGRRCAARSSASCARAILDGSLRAGAQLPSSRVLAATIGVSRGVASDAYGQLEAQGFLSIAPRASPVVASVERAIGGPSRRSHVPTPRFDFIPTTPDVTLFPRRLFATALADAARTATAAALDYGDPAGLNELRQALADHLGLTRGVVTSPEQIVITQGTAQAIDLVLRVLRGRGLARGGRRGPVAREPARARARARARGDRAAGGRTRPHRRRASRRCGRSSCRRTSSRPAPCCAATGAERSSSGRRAGDRYVIEDDYDAEFRYDRVAVRALQGLDPDRVIYVGTTSKTLAPGLRIGWIAAPPSLMEELRTTKNLLDAGSPALPQLALARLLRNGEYARHVRRVRTIYRQRRDVLIASSQRSSRTSGSKAWPPASTCSCGCRPGSMTSRWSPPPRLGGCACRRSRPTASRPRGTAGWCWATAGCTSRRSPPPSASSPPSSDAQG